METKSRYEVIAELEDKKRNLIRERDSFESQVKDKEKGIKELKRDLEDLELELKDFKDSIKEKKATIQELITSINESLKRFENLGKSESQKKQ